MKSNLDERCQTHGGNTYDNLPACGCIALSRCCKSSSAQNIVDAKPKQTRPFHIGVWLRLRSLSPINGYLNSTAYDCLAYGCLKTLRITYDPPNAKPGSWFDCLLSVRCACDTAHYTLSCKDLRVEICSGLGVRLTFGCCGTVWQLSYVVHLSEYNAQTNRPFSMETFLPSVRTCGDLYLFLP